MVQTIEKLFDQMNTSQKEQPDEFRATMAQVTNNQNNPGTRELVDYLSKNKEQYTTYTHS